MDFNGNQTVQGPNESFKLIFFSFFQSFGWFNEQNEPYDSKKDSFIRVWTGESRTEQSKELIKLKLCYLFFKWAIVSLDKTLIHRLVSFKALWTVCTETLIWTPLKSIIWRKILECFHQTLISLRLKKERHGHLGLHGGE